MGKGLDKFVKEINTEVNKIKDEKKKGYYRQTMDQLINHVTDICDDEVDDLMAQNHKSFARAWKFIYDRARDYAVNNCAFVSDSIVFGWFDEYLGTDDKAEVEKEEKQLKELKEKSTSKTSKKSKASAPSTQLDLFDEVSETDDEQSVDEVHDSSTQLSIFDLM